MDSDGHRASASGSSLDSSMSPTRPASSSSGAGELILSGAAGCSIPHPGIGLALGALMNSVSLESRSGVGGVLISEAAGGSTTPAEIEQESPMDSSGNSVLPQGCSATCGVFISEAIPSHNTEQGDLPMISTPQVGSKSATGDGLFSEVPVSPVLSAVFDDLDGSFAPVELRPTGTPECGDIVGDLSSEGGHVYCNDPTLKTRCSSLDLVGPIWLPTRKKWRSSMPVSDRIGGDLCSGRGHLMYSDDLEPKTRVPAESLQPGPISKL